MQEERGAALSEGAFPKGGAQAGWVRLSASARLIIVTVLLACVSASFAIAIATIGIERAVEDSRIGWLQGHATRQADSVELLLQRVVRDLDDAGHDSAVRTVIGRRGGDARAERRSLRQILYDRLKVRRDLSAIGLVWVGDGDQESVFVHRSNEDEPRGARVSGVDAGAYGPIPNVPTFRIQGEGPAGVFVVKSPMRDGDGELLGYVEGQVDLSVATSQFTPMTEGGTILLADRSGGLAPAAARQEVLNLLGPLKPELFESDWLRETKGYVVVGAPVTLGDGGRMIFIEIAPRASLMQDMRVALRSVWPWMFLLAATVIASALLLGRRIGALLFVRASEERRLERERFAAALEAAPSGMLVVESSGAIAFANSEAARMFGYESEELLSLKVEDLIPAHVRAGHAALRALFHGQPTRRIMGKGRDLLAQRKDGELFSVEIGLNPIVTPGGSFVLAAIVDIDERKRVELDLRAKTEELQRSNADLEQFAYIASHDLQEPLRMVASYTQLLAERYSGQLDERADRYIGYATDGARRMQDLVRDLLAYSRVTSTSEARSVVDTSEIVREVLDDLNEAILAAQAQIDVGELPNVYADEAQLRQVFQNLIGNALKFRGDAPARISILAEADRDMATFSVRDNGIGIDPRHFDRIFQMFQRLHERSRYDGSGIGLSIVKKIIERHGGKIWVDSKTGIGTTMTFTWPRAIKAHEARPHSPD